ncbi:MAG: hypothetical protein CL608_06235 [Anaerolineaceae bacterium]|nr:hypothetical protein [Anaerolineaceae bacterium]
MLQASAIVIIGFATAVLLFTAVLLLIWAKVASNLDWLEAQFVAFMGTVIFTGWVSTVLMTLGIFSLALVAGVLFLAAAGLFGWQRPFQRPQFATLKWPEWLLMILLLGSAVVYFRPHEYVLGGIDPGGYMNIAATAVRTGDFILEDEWSGLLREFPETTLREQPPQWRTRYLQFVGWYIDDHDHPARVIPQFFPFHPALVAVGISLAGLYGGLLVTPLWGTLCLATIFLLARQLFNTEIGLLAASLYAITPVHIYFARYPSTEPLTLLLIFTGLLSFQALWDERQGQIAWGILGGASFGVSFLTRIDLPLVALLIVGWLVLVRWQQRWTSGWRWFTLVLGAVSAHAGLSAFFLNSPYMWNTYGSLLNVIRRQLVVQLALAGAVVMLVLGVWLMWRYSWTQFRQTRLANFINGRSFRWLLAGGIVLLSAFAYFVRPLLQPATSYATWPAGTTAWVLDGENWVRMGWYLTPLGLILATLGLAWLLRTASFNRLGFFLSIGILTTLQYVYKIFNTPYHIYTMRRYVPIVLPMLMIYTAVFLFYLFQSRPRVVKISAGVLTVGLMAGLLYQSRFVLPLRDLYGATEALATFHEQLDPEALILISEPPTSMFADTLGPPLKFIFGHDIATVRQDDEADAFLANVIQYAQEQERPLQLIGISPVLESVRTQFYLEPVAFVPIRLPKLHSTFTDFPSDIQNVYYGIEIYNLTPKSGVEVSSSETDSFMVDIGTLDIAYIDDDDNGGFYGKEPLAGDITARWTRNEATIYLPISDTHSMQIEIRARIFRPDDVPDTTVTVWLDNEEVGQFTPTDQWQTYTFTAINEAMDTTLSILSFHTETFNPAELHINNDTRDLGFLIDWIRLTTSSTDKEQ